MKISINWLKNYVDIKVSPEKLSALLTMAGLGVEKQHKVGTDTVLEVEVTPNRPDCLSYLGIAREAAAVLNKSFKAPKVKDLKKVQQKTEITIEDKKGCLRYLGVVVKGVSIKESSQVFQKNLQAIGSRAINNVVDITNFCLMEQGQPLHAFDYDKLMGGKVVVRRAKAGETIVTIDDVERKLDSSILVIADEKRPVAIAGIMGGRQTEVTARTKNILLESAYFDPALIRLAGRKLGLASDSSYRFERRVNFDGVKTGALRALFLILDLAGGSVENFTDKIVTRPTFSKQPIVITKKFIEGSLGIAISLLRCKSILSQLGFEVSTKKDVLKVMPFLGRADVKMGADIVEEIARVVGYDRLPASLPQVRVSSVPVLQKRLFRKDITAVLISLGLDEMVTTTLINQKSLDKTKLVFKDAVKIRNPLSQDQEILRPALLPSFLPVILSNLNRGQKDLRLFEASKIYTPSGEKEALGVMMMGGRSSDWRRMPKEEVDFFDLKGVVERVLEKAGVYDVSFVVAEQPFFEGAQSVVKIGNDAVGYLGKISTEVLNQWDIRVKNIFFAQMDLEKISKQAQPIKGFAPIPEFPAVVRDVSLAVKEHVTFDALKAVVRAQGAEFLSSIRLIEEYIGDKIPAGHRGIIFSLVYQSASRTLREEEVTGVHTRITQALIDRLGAICR